MFGAFILMTYERALIRIMSSNVEGKILARSLVTTLFTAVKTPSLEQDVTGVLNALYATA